MKKFVLALILIVAVAGMAIESGPSNTVGFVTYQTGEGYNYISYSLENPDLASAVNIVGLFPETATVSYVSIYNNESNSWQTWVPGGNNFDLTLGAPVLVAASNVPGDFVFATYGDVPADYAVSYDLYGSYNYVTIPLDVMEVFGGEVMVSEIFETVGSCEYISKYDNELQSFSNTYVAGGNDYAVEIGEVYVIARTSEAAQTVWPARTVTASSNQLQIKSKVETKNESSVDMLNIKKK
jgi:hypothetical protein